ncbi:L,D-transpeptidase [Streptomyces sp. WAC06614]|nr:L,D-transpeptidase [Streptomyces sp. WAC06614]
MKGGPAGAGAEGPRCSGGLFPAADCRGLRTHLVLATEEGARATPHEVSAGRLRGTAPTDAAGPLGISLAAPGRLTDVTVRDRHGRHLAGALDADGTLWENAEPLKADETYVVQVGAQDAAGTTVGAVMALRTAPAAPGERLTASFGPGPGTYGAGQIVTASLSSPVPAADRTARIRVERALRVTSEPQVEGAWHWVDDSTLHYRPRTFWPAHAEVHVYSGLDGVAVDGERYGGSSDPVHFTVGDRIEALTDSAEHTMTVRRNGRVIRTIPVTTGKAGFRTRSGIKVVLRKERQVRMRGDSVGIGRGDREFYDLPVSWATRMTWSGEYVHAAPWSVASQGEENVSHGCTGMSPADAAWFYETVREGDVASWVNTGGEPMTPFDNGLGDWNLDWPAWLAGSALHGTGVTALAPDRRPSAPRLTPSV